MQNETAITTAQLVSILIGTILPIIVGLVTKQVTNSGLKSVLLLALSAISGFGSEFLSSANFVWQQAVLGAVLTFVTGVATHYGFLKPTGTTAKAQRTLVK